MDVESEVDEGTIANVLSRIRHAYRSEQQLGHHDASSSVPEFIRRLQEYDLISGVCDLWPEVHRECRTRCSDVTGANESRDNKGVSYDEPSDTSCFLRRIPSTPASAQLSSDVYERSNFRAGHGCSILPPFLRPIDEEPTDPDEEESDAPDTDSSAMDPNHIPRISAFHHYNYYKDYYYCYYDYDDDDEDRAEEEKQSGVIDSFDIDELGSRKEYGFRRIHMADDRDTGDTCRSTATDDQSKDQQLDSGARSNSSEEMVVVHGAFHLCTDRWLDDDRDHAFHQTTTTMTSSAQSEHRSSRDPDPEVQGRQRSPASAVAKQQSETSSSTSSFSRPRLLRKPMTSPMTEDNGLSEPEEELFLALSDWTGMFYVLLTSGSTFVACLTRMDPSSLVIFVSFVSLISFIIRFQSQKQQQQQQQQRNATDTCLLCSAL